MKQNSNVFTFDTIQILGPDISFLDAILKDIDKDSMLLDGYLVKMIVIHTHIYHLSFVARGKIYTKVV